MLRLPVLAACLTILQPNFAENLNRDISKKPRSVTHPPNAQAVPEL